MEIKICSRTTPHWHHRWWSYPNTYVCPGIKKEEKMTAIIVIWGGGFMLIAGLYCISGLTMGARRLRRRMARNRAYLRLSKGQIGLPLGPVMPPRHRNGHSRTWPQTARELRR